MTEYLAKRCEALERRVRFLEGRLEQRYEATVNEYKDKRAYFSRVQECVLGMFLDLPPATGLSRTEILSSF